MKRILIIVISIIAFSSFSLKADISPEAKLKLSKSEALKQAAPAGYFDNRRATVSNLEFFVSNDGRFSFDIANSRGGGYWPRNSRNQYIFGGGAWFGAQKRFKGTGELRPYVEMSYDPQTANSNFVPGRILDKDLALTPLADQNDIYKYRTYSSGDFDRTTGQAIAPEETSWPAWPVWDILEDDTLKFNRYFGLYIEDEDQRNLETYSKGPAFISGEDMFATFKDSDLNYYEGGASTLRNYGFPLNIQIENMIYSWGFGQYKDFVFIKYDFLNFSTDTLFNCWHAPIMDVDLARAPFLGAGAANDRVRWYSCDDTLNMAVQWTDGDRGERGFGFGYLGFDYLESPSVIRYYWMQKRAERWTSESLINSGETNPDSVAAYVDQIRTTPRWSIFADLPDGSVDTTFVRNPDGSIKIDSVDINPVNPIRDISINGDTTYYPYFHNMEGDTLFPRPDFQDSTGFLRKTKRLFDENEQLGLVTFRNWSIQEDVTENVERYNFLSSRLKDDDTGPGDKRFMMATGPYNMLPFDTARVVVGIILARTAGGSEATGECDDMALLDQLDRFAQEVYDNEFRAPVPPDRPIITSWIPLNNGIKIQWDNRSELSVDSESDGLDFLGYRLFRARRPDLDTFSVVPNSPEGQYANGTGPLGWKQIAAWQVRPPFRKSIRRSGGDPNNIEFPLIDSLRVIGGIENRGLDEDFEYYDQFAIRVSRVPVGGFLYSSDDALRLTQSAANHPKIRNKPIPILMGIDTTRNSYPWGKVFYNLANGSQVFNDRNDGSSRLHYDPRNTGTVEQNDLINDVLTATVFLNRSVVPFNPLLYKKKRIELTPEMEQYLGFLLADPNISLITDGDDELFVMRRANITCGQVYDGLDPETGDSIFVERCDTIETTTVDTAYYYNSIETDSVTVDQNGELVTYTTTYIDIAIKKGVVTNDDGELILDSLMMSREDELEVLNYIYDKLESGSAELRIEYPDFLDSSYVEEVVGQQVTVNEFVKFEESKLVREGVLNEYFSEITNNRTFVDVGDDNRDNIITVTDDPLTTERLINNVNYFYKLVPFDEGDFGKQAERQFNNPAYSGGFITSIVKTYPEEIPAGSPSEFEILSVDSALIGSIHNINFNSTDGQKVQQLFGGDTLELAFEPTWNQFDWLPPNEEIVEKRIYFNLNGANITLTNLSQDSTVIYQTSTQFENIPGNFDFVKSPSEFAASWALTPAVDPITRVIGVDNGEEILDTITDINNVFGTDFEQRVGVFTTGNFDETFPYANGWSNEAYGVMSFNFNYFVRQLGGSFRPHIIEKIGDAENVSTHVDLITARPSGLPLPEFNAHPDQVYTAFPYSDPGEVVAQGTTPNPQLQDNENAFPQDLWVSQNAGKVVSFNNGPGEYILEFLPGGQEQVEFSWGANPANRQTKTFNLNYLNVRVRNVTDLKRYDEVTGDSVSVPYPDEMEYMELPVEPYPQNLGTGHNFYPRPDNMLYYDEDPYEFYGKYNMYAAGFIDTKEGFLIPIQGARPHFAYPAGTPYATNNLLSNITYSGLQGRYYLSGTSVDGENVVDFSHIVNINGALFVLDYARHGFGQNERNRELNWEADPYPIERPDDITGTTDFQPGHEVRLVTYGGAQGLPWDGAKIKVRVTQGSENQTEFTEGELSDIRVVPNPFYVTHEDVQSPYVTEIFFTKLPKKCTIDIYTQNGQLVETLEHEGADENGRKTVDIWDLLTKSGLRVQSQTLIAVITTDDGTQISRPFSVVVGSYRILN